MRIIVIVIKMFVVLWTWICCGYYGLHHHQLCFWQAFEKNFLYYLLKTEDETMMMRWYEIDVKRVVECECECPTGYEIIIFYVTFFLGIPFLPLHTLLLRMLLIKMKKKHGRNENVTPHGISLRNIFFGNFCIFCHRPQHSSSVFSIFSVYIVVYCVRWARKTFQKFK